MSSNANGTRHLSHGYISGKIKWGRGRGKWMIQRLNEESPPRTLYQIKHQRRRRLRKRHSKKMNWRCFKLYAYSISFNSSNVANFFWSWILKDCIENQVKKKQIHYLVFIFSRSPLKVYLHGHFHVVVVVQRRQRNVQKSVMHVQSRSFANVNVAAKKYTKKRDARAESFFC